MEGGGVSSECGSKHYMLAVTLDQLNRKVAGLVPGLAVAEYGVLFGPALDHGSGAFLAVAKIDKQTDHQPDEEP
jgi:hypothetical protein